MKAIVESVLRYVSGVTHVRNVAEVSLMLWSYPSSALTGQSMVVSHGWFMQ